MSVAARKASSAIVIPDGAHDAELTVGRRLVRLTNLPKVFWPESGITKRALLQYYADVAMGVPPLCPLCLCGKCGY